jgi:hypothetical protein
MVNRLRGLPRAARLGLFGAGGMVILLCCFCVSISALSKSIPTPQVTITPATAEVQTTARAVPVEIVTVVPVDTLGVTATSVPLATIQATPVATKVSTSTLASAPASTVTATRKQTNTPIPPTRTPGPPTWTPRPLPTVTWTPVIVIVPTSAPATGGCVAGAMAVCCDGTISFSTSRRGTCSHHGGVCRWCQ